MPHKQSVKQLQYITIKSHLLGFFFDILEVQKSTKNVEDEKKFRENCQCVVGKMYLEDKKRKNHEKIYESW